MRRKSNHKSIHVITLGCSKNVVDSEVLLRQIESNGLTVYHNASSCDARAVIINTCGFIRDAKQESIDTILSYIKAKEEGQLDNVFVMGCLSERYKKELEHEIPEVDKYFGVNDLGEIIKTLDLDLKHNLLGERFLTTPSHYAFLKISEGCNRKCAFCAIPLIRGRHRSVPPEMLVQQADYLASRGVKELILIAQDLTWYGIDLSRRQMLPELLRKLSDVKGIEWIRLHYAYPAAFPREVIQVMKERDNICHYLDIPFQHNYDAVLKKMNRGHNRQQNLELIDFIRGKIPDITLRTTLITGYPGETEKAYAVLRDFVEQVQFDRLGVFTYSEEENTTAAKKYTDRIPGKTKRERAAELMAIQQAISTGLNNKKIGRLYKVLIDAKEGEYYTGRTEGDSPEIDNEVLISEKSGPLNKGCFYMVKITGAEAFDLTGEVV